MKAVTLQNIFLNYHSDNGETQALKDLSFDVAEGEFISIVGPSGCGKSTLLSIIAGLIAPSAGEMEIRAGSAKKTATIGYMLQKDHLFEWRTIFNNVCLGLEIQGKLTPQSKALARELLHRYGLGDFMDKMPSQLSGGMRQRAALIRTLAIEPDILLLDEPFSALDYQTRLYVADEIGDIIRKENKTAILVTHDISEAVFTINLTPSKASKIAWLVHTYFYMEKFCGWFFPVCFQSSCA